MLQPGTQIGRYEIQRKLARGGMGTVYVAHDPILGRMVALKVFVGDLDVPDAAERFAREARAAASLNHTNIVTIYDFGDVESQPYIVMEYIQGETMAEIIRRRTPVPVSEKVRWLEELCSGVASAHKMDVIHRDIKPGNLMIDRSGRLKILDFGIAKIVNSLGNSMTAVIGTPGYMAPEQLLGQRVDARTDVFAIGAVAFELITYEEAFQGDSFTSITHRIINENVRHIADVVPDVPPELCALVEQSLQKDPADRFQDAESLRVALSRVRRRIETTTDFDASDAPTIISPITIPVRRIGTGTSEKAAAAGVRTAEMTPPPDPVADREAVARARALKIEASLQRGEACLQNGELEKAAAACREVRELEPTHAGAVALDQRIAAALARQRAAALLADARAELDRGALTRCKSLLDEARQLDPQSKDTRLERDLRLARVEEERKRQRTETANRTAAAARAALERGDMETALACAREALSLNPEVGDAREIETEALRALEATDEGRPTLAAPVDDEIEGTTVVPLPQVARPPAPPPAPPEPPLRQTVVDAPTEIAVPVPTGTSAPASAPVPVPAQVPARPSAKPPQRDPLAGLRTAIARVPLRSWIDRGRVAAARVGARARLIPRQQWLMAAGFVGAVRLGAAIVAFVVTRPAPVPAEGLVVIEAVPWANVTAITAADGSARLSSPAATPLSTALPVGTYTVVLVGPPPANERRTLTVDVKADRVTVAPATRFQAPTSDEYFTRYFGGDAPAAPGPEAAAPGVTP